MGGSNSDPSQEAAVYLAHVPPDGDPNFCTATLIAPRLILTARHCIAASPDGPVSCESDGRQNGSGGTVLGDYAATDLLVFVGAARPSLLLAPASRGVRIFSDGSTSLCDHDLALVLLDAPITTVPVAKIRLESDVELGEPIVAVGYGWTLTTPVPPIRQQRGDVRLLRAGPSEGFPTLTANEFSFTDSICRGDSGGPLFSQRSGAVIGVTSRAPNPCTNTENIGTKLQPFEAVIRDAFNAAGATPQLEDWSLTGCR